MSYVVADELFQSRTRSAVLRLLFVEKRRCSVSELARHSGLSPRAVGNEVRHLRRLELVTVETEGGADVVRGNLWHPATRSLRALLMTRAADPATSSAKIARESLAGWGAPLGGVRRKRHWPLVETLLRGLEQARHDATMLRVLPTALAKHVDEVDWSDLSESARRRKLKAEVGWLVELTATLLGREDLKAHVAGLHDRRRKTQHYFPEVKSSFEQQLARKRTAQTARAWGFWMNVPEESFASTMRRHA